MVFDFLKVETKNNYVLTNNLYEDDEDRDLYNQVKDMAEARGSKFIPIRLVIAEEEHLKRLTQLDRGERWKSVDPEEVNDQTPLLNIEHQNYLKLDVSTLKAEGAAEFILRAGTMIRLNCVYNLKMMKFGGKVGFIIKL